MNRRANLEGTQLERPSMAECGVGSTERAAPFRNRG